MEKLEPIALPMRSPFAYTLRFRTPGQEGGSLAKSRGIFQLHVDLSSTTRYELRVSLVLFG